MGHQKENDIQSAILDYLALKRVFAIRINIIPATYIDKAGARPVRRSPKHTPHSIADILVINDSGAIFLEVKSEIGKQSAEQKNSRQTRSRPARDTGSYAALTMFWGWACSPVEPARK
jgi:hypothetical protein